MNNKDSSRSPYKYSSYYGNNNSPNMNTKSKKAKKSHKLIKILLVLVLIAGVGFGGYIGFRHHTRVNKIVSTIIKPTKKTQPTSTAVVNQQLYNTMTNAVNTVIQANSNITFEVAVNDLNDGSTLNFGQSTTVPMTAASVSKILTATDYLQEVEAGDKTMSETLDDGNTASSDLESLIVVSNDNAWAALDDSLTNDQLQTYAQNLGISSFNVVSNTLSARDTANLMTSLYQGKLINASDTKLLLSYLYQANYRTYILPAIPSTDTVYHKIGLYNDNVNDATIITNGKQTISLVIFTNGNGAYNWPNRALLMQAITKPILTYYGLN
jgi:beta-lactamase class A